MCAGTLALEGCAGTTTTTVRPDSLPELSESAARHPQGWHDATSTAGERMTLKGPITSVAVHDKGLPPRRDVFEPPFLATLTDDQLSVRHGQQMSSYSLATVARVVVTYSTTRQNTSYGLIAGSVPFLLLGTCILVYGVYYTASAGDETLFKNIGGFIVGVGAGTVAVGAALLIPGVVMLGDPRKNEPRKRALELGPGSVRIRVAF